MNMETSTASLHSGLIQRARPKVVPLREEPGAARADVVPLRAGDVGRARAVASLVDIGRTPLARALSRAIAAVEPVAAQDATAAVFDTPARRFGLTVRVGAELRERLGDARERTGRTGQSILHDALASYLTALERRQTER